MNTELQQDVAPVAETQNTATAPAEKVVAEPNPTDGADPSGAKPVDKTAEQKLADSEAARQRRITKLERTNARLYQEAEGYRQKVQDFERNQPARERQAVEVDPQEVQQLIQTRAREIASDERLTERCNAIATKGAKEFPDWGDALASISSELPLFDRNNKPTPALEALMDADSPHALMRHLGKNPDLASELSELSPIQLAKRLDRIEREMKPERQVSNAPKPLETVKSASAAAMPDPTANPAAWRAWRNKNAK